MFPPAPLAGSPNAAGPAGLDAAVQKLFAPGNPNGPADPYTQMDNGALLERFKEFKQDAENIRWVFERQWWMILLYVLGRQWIFFDGKRNEWRDKRLKKWIPKPVTNKMKEVQAAIRSMFAAVQLGVIARPNGNDSKNIATAATADGLQPLIHDEHKMETVLDIADFWFTNLGNCFLHPWWDKDGGTVKPVYGDVCMTCGTPQDQQPDPNAGADAANQKNQPKPTVDPTTGAASNPNTGAPELSTPATTPVPPALAQALGVPQCPICGNTSFQQGITDMRPVGKGCTDAVSPFELMLPSSASQFEEVERLVRIRWRPKLYYEINYPEIVNQLVFEHNPNERSMVLFKALAAQNNLVTTPFTFGSGQRSQTLGLTEYEYWEKPNKQWPKGLFFRVLGENSQMILDDPDQSSPGPLPFETVKGEVLWPWVHMAYERFGGKLWADGAIDPLIQKQDQINRLDSLVELGVQRMSNPIWLEPKGAEVERFTGEPGLVVKYQTIGTTGLGKPERLDSTGPHASLFSLREQYLADIEQMAGTYDILKGQKPTGVEAYSALQLLVERSESRFTRAFKARGEAYREWYSIAIELERKYGPTERTWAMLGPNNKWTFNTFQQADLQGDCNIVCEDGTNVPKTALAKRAAMEQARNMGFVQPGDPDQTHAFLSEMGLQNLMPGLDTAKKAALRQQDAFEQWASQAPQIMANQPPPLRVQPWDNPQIMLNELQKWANGDKMQALMDDPQRGPIVQNYLNQFYGQLAKMIQEAMAQQLPQANHNAPPQHPHAPGGPSPRAGQPGHVPGHGQAMANSERNSSQPPIQHGNTAAPIPPA